MSAAGSGASPDGETPATAPAGWYADPEAPWQARYWDGSTWAPSGAAAPGTSRPGSDRPAPPGLLLAGAAVFFTVLGIATGLTMWPADGASCHDHPPAAYPFGVTLSLWLLGVVLAVSLVVVTYVRRQQATGPWLILLGTMVLPLFVALISAEDCLA